jgi:DNA-binding response OmpR family regulator
MTKPFRFEELVARVRAHLRFHDLQADRGVDVGTQDEDGSRPAVAPPKGTARRAP